MRSEESVSGNPIDRRSTTKEDIAVIQEKPSEVLRYLYSLIYVLDLVQLTFDGRDPLIDLFFLAIEPLPIYDLEEGEWKVVHRHADPITTPQPAESVIQE